MKKISTVAVATIFTLLTGCAAETQYTQSGWYYRNNEFWSVQGRPGEMRYYDSNGQMRTYRQPRSYNISDQDQRKYENMNERIQHRKQSIQNSSEPSGGFGDNNSQHNPSNGMGGVNSHTAPQPQVRPSIPSVPASDS